MTQTISAQKMRTNLGEMINKVYYNDLELVVERKGKPMIKITRFGGNDSGISNVKAKYMRFAGVLGKKNIKEMKESVNKIRSIQARKIKDI